MGYPTISNPSEQLKYEDICVSELEYGSYRVSAVVNGELSMRDTDKQDANEAIKYFKEICQRWAKYSPNYNVWLFIRDADTLHGLQVGLFSWRGVLWMFH